MSLMRGRLQETIVIWYVILLRISKQILFSNASACSTVNFALRGLALELLAGKAFCGRLHKQRVGLPLVSS